MCAVALMRALARRRIEALSDQPALLGATRRALSNEI
jgi:hypothetical protein